MRPCSLTLLLLLFVALGLSAPSVRAQPADAEAAVRTALEQLLPLARSAEAEALGTHLACTTGAPGALYIRTCVPSADSTRIAGIAAALRATFAPGTRYILDALAPGVDEAATDQPAAYRAIWKLYASGSDERTGEAELRFLAHGTDVLLADAWPEMLTPPVLPTPTSPEEEIRQAMTMLFRLTRADQAEDAAAFMACLNAAARTIHRCDYADANDRDRVEDFRRRISALQARVGQTGYGFMGYRTKDEREGTWHLLEISYLDGEAPGGERTAYAAFIETGDGLGLGDLVEWPE